MESENNIFNITYVKNLDKQSFNSTFNLQVDAKVNIKTILNVSCYVFDEKIETASGKAVISGKFCIKVLYLDTDNITNTLSDNQPFSETILDNSITGDCFINLNNLSVLSNVISTDGSLKIDCSLSFIPILYVNLAVKNVNIDTNEFVTKKSSFNTNTILNKIDTSFNHTSNIETKDNVSKILHSNSSFILNNTTAKDGFIVVEGIILTKVIYETIVNDSPQIKEICDSVNIKTDVEIDNITQDNILDLIFRIDKSCENISIDLEDDTNTIIIENKIKVCGVVLKQTFVDVIEDLFCVHNEIDLTKSERECVEETISKSLTEVVGGETSLNKEDSAIEEIVSNSNINTEITNSYVKNNFLHIEGIITSTLIYIDENKEYKNKQLETPFIINTKFELEKLCSNHIDINVLSSKTKIRRGTIVNVEYELNIDFCLYKCSSKEFLDNVTIGKMLDFSQYDYQIFIAKPNETIWELCKRIKCYPDELNKYNKDIPSQFNGGEKIIIKR